MSGNSISRLKGPIILYLIYGILNQQRLCLMRERVFIRMLFFKYTQELIKYSLLGLFLILRMSMLLIKVFMSDYYKDKEVLTTSL